MCHPFVPLCNPAVAIELSLGLLCGGEGDRFELVQMEQLPVFLTGLLAIPPPCGMYDMRKYRGIPIPFGSEGY